MKRRDMKQSGLKGKSPGGSDSDQFSHHTSFYGGK